MLCWMDIHNFPSMPSEPNSTAACRFSSWNIMGHSHSLVEKCWKRFGAFKTLLPVPVEAENSTFRWASLEMCWNVLNQKDPTMIICLFFLRVFIRKLYHNERLLIKFRWSHPMSYHVIPTVPCHAEPVQVFWVQRSNYHDVLALQVGKQKTQDSISNLLHIVYMMIHVLLTNLLTYPYRTSNILLPCLLSSFGPFDPWRGFIMLDNASYCRGIL